MTWGCASTISPPPRLYALSFNSMHGWRSRLRKPTSCGSSWPGSSEPRGRNLLLLGRLIDGDGKGIFVPYFPSAVALLHQRGRLVDKTAWFIYFICHEPL